MKNILNNLKNYIITHFLAESNSPVGNWIPKQTAATSTIGFRCAK